MSDVRKNFEAAAKSLVEAKAKYATTKRAMKVEGFVIDDHNLDNILISGGPTLAKNKEDEEIKKPGFLGGKQG